MIESICVEFEIPGPPIRFERPRWDSARRITFNSTVYTDGKKRIKHYAKMNAVPEMVMHPCELMAVFHMGMPAKSWPEKKKIAAMEGRSHFDKTPDVDNLIKAVMDGCNKILWSDDAKVVRIDARKQYGFPARTEVQVRWTPNEVLDGGKKNP